MEELFSFVKELAERSEVTSSDDDEQEEQNPLRAYLEAVAVFVSPRRKGEDDDPDALAPEGDRTVRALPSVRRVHGGTKREVRERLMLAFNSPLFPEVLVSSAVLGEGVDLHRFCRHVIHHDLCWNPSTLEQRTGRVDRIGAKAERCNQSIHVYLPYVAGTQDEKMYRVVRDRERWFQVVMGEKFDLDERHKESIGEGIPLPGRAVQALVLRLISTLRLEGSN